MADKNTVKNWFKTDLKPTQSQFWSFFDSIWFKDEKIPVADIEGIEGILNAKADAQALTNHVSDQNAHNELFDDIKSGATFLVNRNNKMFFSNELIPGDIVIGKVEDVFLNAGTYFGGETNLLSSFEQNTSDLTGTFDNTFNQIFL